MTRFYDKGPYNNRIILKAKWKHKNASKNVHYITIAERLRTVSRSSNSHPADVFEPVYERSTVPLTTTAV